MFGFFLKKNFSDIWDNILFILLSNLFANAVVAAALYSLYRLESIPDLARYIIVVAGAGIFMIFIFAWGENAARIADFGVPSWKSFFASIPSSIVPGFSFGALFALLLIVARIAFSFYFILYKNGNIMGIFLAALIGWFTFVVILAMQWFVPLYSLQENSFGQCIKKAFIIFFDNAKFSFACLLNNIILLALSVFTLGFIPGVNGLLLTGMNALRLRLYKYDWYEQHPEILEDRDKRSEVPWDELLAEDKESLGPVKLSTILMPWKNWK